MHVIREKKLVFLISYKISITKIKKIYNNLINLNAIGIARIYLENAEFKLKFFIKPAMLLVKYYKINNYLFVYNKNL
jgi:hypothetical protein